MKFFRYLIAALALFTVGSPAFSQAIQDNSAVGRSGALVPCTTRQGTSILCVVNGTVTVDPTTGTPAAPGALVTTNTYTLVTIATGGTAQDALAANTSRKLACVQAGTANTTTSRLNEGANATSSLGIELSPGAQWCSKEGFVSTARISVYNATTGATFNVVSGQ